MNRVERAAQIQLDREILFYARGMASTAPVTQESVLAYLTGPARMRVSALQVDDRVNYLISAGYLERRVTWENGEVERLLITAKGMDLLDGNIPPPGWTGEK